MKNVRSLLLLMIVIGLMAGCTRMTKEQQSIVAYELEHGKEIKFKNFESFGDFTYQDSIRVWQDSINSVQEVYLILLDSAEAKFDRGLVAAVEGKASNTYKELEGQFDQMIETLEQRKKGLDSLREAAKTDGVGTPMEDYYKKIAELKEKGDEVLFKHFRADMEVNGNMVTKIYYVDPTGEKVINTVTIDPHVLEQFESKEN